MEMKASLSQGHPHINALPPRLPLETRNLSHPHCLPQERAKFRQIISPLQTKTIAVRFQAQLDEIAELCIDTGEGDDHHHKHKLATLPSSTSLRFACLLETQGSPPLASLPESSTEARTTGPK
ncbi:unnamed protein product [Urochloa humidicola]